MADQRKSPLEFTVEDLDRELIARGAQNPGKKQFKFKDKEGTPERNAVMTGIQELYETPPPPNEALAHISTWDLAKILIFKSRGAMDFTRGAWSDDLMDGYEIADDPINQNVDCTAAICMKDSLIEVNNEFSTLKVKNYGETFNLCDIEPFSHQPIAAGIMFTGFLVKDDVIATAGHTVNEENVTNLRILFGYKMVDSVTPVTSFANENIYQGVKIIPRVHSSGGNGSDWALVKLDRKVVGQTVARLSTKEISCDQAIYVIGHPLGLPMKYAGGVYVGDVDETSFMANLNIYSGNSGAPVFDLNTNEFIGMVVRGEKRDFRWTGNCWISVEYPEGKRAQCTRVSEFIDIVREL
ncbi:trypsin-like serine peptidase [Acidobacteriota bacterium]